MVCEIWILLFGFFLECRKSGCHYTYVISYSGSIRIDCRSSILIFCII